MDATNYEIRKALVSLAVEEVLGNISDVVFEEVTRRLYKNYKCYIPDCFDNPQYLKKVLQELYGYSHNTIIESITNKLNEFSRQREISSFLKVICN